MAKTVACIIARTVSRRLPKKVMLEVLPGVTMLDYMISRIKKSSRVDEIYLCTSVEPEDDPLQMVAERNQIHLYRGSPDKVIERMIDVGNSTEADVLIRITGDNVFTSYEFLDRQIESMEAQELEYVRLTDVPIGATAEVMSFDALKRCYQAIDPAVSEYLMLFMFDPDTYRCGTMKPFQEDYSGLSLTVDTPHDMARTLEIFRNRGEQDAFELELETILKIISDHDVPYAEFTPGSSVKLPYGKEISFREFQEDMQRRVSKSIALLP